MYWEVLGAVMYLKYFGVCTSDRDGFGLPRMREDHDPSEMQTDLRVWIF